MMYLSNDVLILFTDKNLNLDEKNKHVISDIGSSDETIDTIFSTFIDKMIDTLKNKSDLKKVTFKCLYKVYVTGGIKLPNETLDKLEKAEDFDDLFVILCRTPYWNWMNIRMLEKMAGDCSPAQELIDEYKSKVYSRKLKDVLSEIPILDIPTDKYTVVKVKYEKNFNDVTIKDIVKQWNDIEKMFNVEEAMLLQSITKGCVEICWLLPNKLVDHAISSVTNNQPVECSDQSATEELFSGVLYLKIGNDVIKDDITSM